jgi:dihydrofolate reductase
MARLVYLAIASLDGYIEDESGRFDWARPDDDVHQFVNDLERDVGTYLYGRRMYETMAVWETDPSLAEHSAVTRDYAEIWGRAEKVVYSRTLDGVSTRRTRIERTFDPEAVRELKASAESDLGIGGAELAAEALKAGLVDECHLVLAPVVVGAGKPAFGDVRIQLELLQERRFEGGMVFLRYGVSASPLNARRP